MKCAARAAPVSAVFTLGDNFYGNGVASADDPQFEFKGRASTRTPRWTCRGTPRWETTTSAAM